MLTPYYAYSASSTEPQIRWRVEKPNTSIDATNFCYSFVVETSLSLQEFDLEI